MRALKVLGYLALVTSVFVPSSASAVFFADDICAPTANPCVISKTVKVDSGAVLDFGLRAVQIINSGQLDSGAGEATLRCGSFNASGGTTPGIKARGSSGAGTTDGGFFSLEANRACSLDSDVLCLANRGCQFGTCSASVCSGNAARACSSDAQCDLGTCNASKQCTGATNFPCANDADCQVGTCSDTTCSLNRLRSCANDADCDAGTCTSGSGDIVLNRKARADGFEPGGITIRGAGDVTINELINVEATNLESDGGIIEIESGTGTITVNANLKAKGGGLSGGGEICMIAGEDIITTKAIDADGGDFDGGFIEIDAIRDVRIGHDLSASSTNGEGFGGEIDALAGRDIIFSGSSKHRSNGHMSAFNFGGDGGAQDYSAARNIVVGPDVSFECNGAGPDGSGDTIAMTAEGTLTVNGDLRAKAGGGDGSGGGIELTSEGLLTIATTALLDVGGSSGGGGDIDIFGGDNMSVTGVLDSSGSNGGFAGRILIDSDGTLDVTGTVGVNGSPFGASNGSIDIQACRMNLKNGAVIDNRGGFGSTFLTSRERVSVLAGSTVRSQSTGMNTIIYRDVNKPPILNGTITPPPTLVVDELLIGCPLCGNAELEQTETCDDGNLTNGDGCSSQCQDEACIAQTPGYPAVPLCDDGDGCTTDSCNAGTCEHLTSCDDGIDCTVDSCGAGNQCVHTPGHIDCDDDNDCTVDSCSVTLGCSHAFSNGLCDDDVACTDNDVCFMGICSGIGNCVMGEFCIEETGECSAATTTTTTTTTTLAQQCGNGTVEFPESCDDGDTSWAQGEYCDAGCDELGCGDTDDTGAITATDSLFALNVAVGLNTCDACICDTDNSGAITAQDALRLLRNAVGLQADLTCSACPN